MTEIDRQAKAVAKKETLAKYKAIVPFTKNLFQELQADPVKLLTTMHVSILGLDKTKKLRPIEDLKYFLIISNQYELNPFKKEVYATYVWNSVTGREELTPIVSIHGLRKLARKSRSPRYAYTGKAEIEFDENNKLKSVTVPVFGTFNDNTPVETASYTAYYDEFVRTKKDGSPTSTWAKMPVVMLTKCAEANAIRQAFDISGLYIEEEISHNENKIIENEDIKNE